MGGAKFKTKLPLIYRFLDVAEKIFVCGALANDIYRARGWEIGRSLFDGTVSVEPIARHQKIEVPRLVLTEAKNGRSYVKSPAELARDERIVDASSEFVGRVEESVKNARLVIWNGPLGDYEHGYEEATEGMAKVLSQSSGFTIVGGGDTLAAISSLNLYESINFISTGGGAMLDFLSRGTLPGIEALKATA